MTSRLRDRFEHVCRAELDRLRRKTAALSPSARDDVHTLTLEVTRAIAGHLEAALDEQKDPRLHEIVGRLFAVSGDVVTGATPGDRDGTLGGAQAGG